MTAPLGRGMLAVIRRNWRAAGALILLTALAACGHPQQQSALSESAQYAAHAHGNYTPPGPPEDPWGPYIREASARYDVPEQWIRALMRVESGGKEYINGQLVTSGVGAMGLMQVMPATYDILRDRYNLGDDPYNPHDNIMAGVAYMREMYEIYGTPGFLAAYNAGPGRLDDYLSNQRPLPDETRHYVAMIAPAIQGIYPNNRSAADMLAYNALPMNIPPGRRYGRAVLVARNNRGGGRLPQRTPIEVAQLPEPHRRGAPASQQVALFMPPPPPPPHGGFRLIAQANAADAMTLRHERATAGQWAIQVGAFNTEAIANAELRAARQHAEADLSVAHPHVSSVRQGHRVLWRARMVGMSRDTAAQACVRITHSHGTCIVLSPEAQS